jgi:cyclopropane fatty-acyl-phospholipid synthase-like methyltransferase
MEFPATDFDDWAETYDQDVLADSFPFAGYDRALGKTLALAQVKPGLSVLDLGTGTGNLARRFYDQGCRLWCTDFSPGMIARARKKLPHAVCEVADLRGEWPQALALPFDRIVSAYVFHHFPLDEKVRILRRISGLLAAGGWMVIADIAFRDLESLQATRLAAGEAWEEEYYWIADQAIAAFEQADLKLTFHPVSDSAGVFVIFPV